MKYFYLYFALFCLGATSMVSCVDSDDDVFGEKLEIVVSNIEKDLHVNVGNNLTLSPEIYPSDREYDCFWGVANKNNQYSVIDTISRERNLNYSVSLGTGNYTLRFCAKDKETGIFSYTEYNLIVETDMSTGWWVLKKSSNGTDVDLHTPTKAINDILYSRNGKAMSGDPVDLAYTPNFFIFDPVTDKNVNNTVVFLTSNNDMVVVDYFTGIVKRTYEDMFVDLPTNRSIQAIFKGASDVHLVADGNLYTLPISKYSPYYRQFVIKHTGNYQLSPYRVASGWSNPMLFDDACSSFCIVDRGAPELIYGVESASPAHRNLNMDLVYLGGRTTGSNGGENGYAILKEKNSGKYYLAYLDATKSSSDMNSTNASYNQVISTIEEMPEELEVVNAEIKALSQDNNFIYFVKDNKLFSCNLDTFEEREQTIDVATGETITYVEYAKFMQPWNDQSSWFGYLLVGTKVGDGYKLYLHPVQGGNTLPAEKVLEGKGEVKRAIYIANMSGTIYPQVYL